MLIIVEHGNVEHPFESLFNVKTFRCFNIFQIDSAKRWRNCFNHTNDLFGIVCVQFDVEHIHISELLEQHTLAFHHRLARQRAAITQTQNRRAIGNDGDQICFRSVFVSGLRVALNFDHCLCHTGRVSQ